LSYWFEVAIVATIFAVGNILFGHFEEGTPKWRRVLKLFLVMGLAVAVSAHLGRVWFWVFLLAMLLPAVYIHVWWLPSKGVNGWTGEPKERYYELRGWKARQ
jgi:small-conductance mechanosensitive channel